MSLPIDPINEIFNTNLEVLKKYFPNIYKEMKTFIPQKARLINDNEEINFVYDDLKGYPYSPKEFCRKQTDKFMEDAYRVVQFPEDMGAGDDLIATRYVKKIFDISPVSEQEMQANRKHLHTDPEGFKKNYFRPDNTKEIPILILIGVGLGYHIEYILENFDVKHLIIYEPEKELFYLSLYTADWAKICKYSESKNKTLNIHLGTDIRIVSENIQNLTPILIVNSLFYQHYSEKKMPIFKDLLDKIFLVTSGFGYYDDEKWSLQHTIGNIKNKIPVYSNYEEIAKDAVAFVIAAGPSLDKDIDAIKKHTGKAIVFSCGTALKTLLKEGIMPDFHVEIERTYDTYEALASIDKKILSQLSIIGMNTLHPDVYSLFKESYMFLKSNDAGVDLFPKSLRTVYSSNPTVTNGALALTVAFGFKNIYMFGVDMGFKHPKHHHSRDNVALDKSTKFYLEEEKKFEEVEGNFGGKVFTNYILQWARNVIELLFMFAEKNEINVYNCSDGAKIDKTHPLKAEDINLDDIPFNKTKTIKLIKSRFNRDYLENLDTNTIVNKYYKKLKKTVKLLSNILDKKVENKSEVIDIFYNIYQHVLDNILLRGTLSQMQISIYSHLLLLDKENDKLLKFINGSFEIMRDFLSTVEKDIKKEVIDKFKE